MLRLSNSVVGPVTVAVGATAPVQALEASNIGDGALSLTLTVEPSAAWLTATVGFPGACLNHALQVPCIPLRFQLDTASLGQGTYTAAVTVSDPHAVDSPQVITVTVRIGTSKPTSIDRYIDPGRSINVANFPGTGPSPTVSTQDGGMWLAVVFSQMIGTFRMYSSYMVQMAPPPNMASGDYHGAISVAGSPVIPVTMRVTRQPIAWTNPTELHFRLAQGGPPMTYPFLPYIALANSGMSTLTVSDVTGSGPGVSAYSYQGLGIVTVDPGSLAPGEYRDGLVTFQCNAANCPFQVPVRFTIVPPGPPVIQYRGVVDTVTFYPEYKVSPGDVVVAKGEQLSLQPLDVAVSAPLPTTLGGATVSVNGVLAHLYYSSFGQIAFQMPSATAPGVAFVQVVRDGQPGNTVSVNVATRAPQILVTDTQYRPLDLQHPAAAGDTVIVWAIGLGATNPAVPDGTLAASPAALATILKVDFEGRLSRRVTPTFAGLGGGAVGLYQVNVALPQDAPPGSILLSLHSPEASIDFVTIGVK